MTTNYKSTIGGAFSALGTALVGIGVLPQLAGSSNKLLLYVALAGFFCQAVGTFLSALFAADAAALRALAVQVDQNHNAILATRSDAVESIKTGHTDLLEKPTPVSKPSP